MSMKTHFPSEIPEETRQIVEPLLEEDSVYRLIGQEAEQIVGDEAFEAMYAEDGRPAVNAVVLVLVTVFQFMEKLPDRAAATMAVMRLDWKYALRQTVTWEGFHYSDLCNFRKRLLLHGQEGAVFEKVLTYLRVRGYVKAGGKQRTDSTHIVGAVMRLSRLELAWESLRVALRALVSTDAPWTLRWIPDSFVQTYSVRRSDFRLSKAEINQALRQSGADGYWLLAQLERAGNSVLQTLPEIVQLRRVWDEQFRRQADGSTCPRPPGEAGGDVINNPHDPEVHYGDKGSHQWLGYKLQVTESTDPTNRTHFITDVAITSTVEQDNTQLEAIQQRLAVRQLLPAQHYVDQGYVSADNIAQGLTRGVDLRGLVREGNVTQSVEFRLSQFAIDFEQRVARCPNGKQSVKWVTAKTEAKNLIAYHVSFGRQCKTCPFFGPGLCTDKPSGRYLAISRYHALIQARRKDAQTPAFRQEMHIRAGIEATISELVRAHAARRARYHGKAKTQLQAFFIATATNLKRLARLVYLPFAPRTIPLPFTATQAGSC